MTPSEFVTQSLSYKLNKSKGHLDEMQRVWERSNMERPKT